MSQPSQMMSLGWVRDSVLVEKMESDRGWHLTSLCTSARASYVGKTHSRVRTHITTNNNTKALDASKSLKLVSRSNFTASLLQRLGNQRTHPATPFYREEQMKLGDTERFAPGHTAEWGAAVVLWHLTSARSAAGSKYLPPLVKDPRNQRRGDVRSAYVLLYEIDISPPAQHPPSGISNCFCFTQLAGNALSGTVWECPWELTSLSSLLLEEKQVS